MTEITVSAATRQLFADFATRASVGHSEHMDAKPGTHGLLSGLLLTAALSRLVDPSITGRTSHDSVSCRRRVVAAAMEAIGDDTLPLTIVPFSFYRYRNADDGDRAEYLFELSFSVAIERTGLSALAFHKLSADDTRRYWDEAKASLTANGHVAGLHTKLFALLLPVRDSEKPALLIGTDKASVAAIAASPAAFPA